MYKTALADHEELEYKIKAEHRCGTHYQCGVHKNWKSSWKFSYFITITLMSFYSGQFKFYLQGKVIKSLEVEI